MSDKRKRIWIHRLQTSLAIRIACYFVLYQLSIWTIVAIQRAMNRGLASALGSEVTFNAAILPVTAALILGFFFIRDAIRMTHRVVGPLYRFRQTIKALTAGEEVRLVGLRQGDELQEMKDEINEMLRFLEQRGAVVLKQPEVKQSLEQGQPGSTPTLETQSSQATVPVP